MPSSARVLHSTYTGGRCHCCRLLQHLLGAASMLRFRTWCRQWPACSGSGGMALALPAAAGLLCANAEVCGAAPTNTAATHCPLLTALRTPNELLKAAKPPDLFMLSHNACLLSGPLPHFFTAVGPFCARLLGLLVATNFYLWHSTHVVCAVCTCTFTL